MAVRADANSEYLRRTTGTFFNTAGISVLFWANLLVDRNASGCGWILTSPSNDYIAWYNSSGDGTTYLWECGDGPQLGSLNLSLNTWYCLALTRAGGGATQTVVYRRLVGDTTWTTASGQFATSFDPSAETILSNHFDLTNGWFPGRIVGVKQWNTVLTADELWQESQQFFPLRQANLAAWYPMVGNTVAASVIDHSGNGRNLTSNGTLSIEDGPPIAWRQGRRRIFIPSASSAQTISPSGIASEEGFGSATLTTGAVTVSPSAIASGETFGSSTVTPGPVTVSPSGIASAEAFGDTTVSPGAATISPTSIAAEEAFGTATLAPGSVSVSPTGIASAEAFGTAGLGLSISPAGIATAEAFGSPIPYQSAYNLEVLSTADLIAYYRLNETSGASAFDSSINEHTGTYTSGPTLAQSGLADTGDPAVLFDGSNDYIKVNHASTLNLSTGFSVECWIKWDSSNPSGYTLVLGKPGSNSGVDDNYTLWLFNNNDGTIQIQSFWGNGGFVSSENVSVVNGNNYHIVIATDGTTVGKAYLNAVDVTDPDLFFPLALSGTVNSSDLFIAWGVDGGSIYPAFKGVLDEVAIYSRPLSSTEVGDHFSAASAGTQNVSPTGITTAEGFGSATLTPGAVSVSPAGIATSEAFGSATVSPGAVTLSPTGIATDEAFGTATLTPGVVSLSPTSIDSAEAFGSATLVPGAVSVTPTGIATEEAFGNPALNLNIAPAGIGSDEAFGTAALNLFVLPGAIASAEVFGDATLSAGNTVSPSSIASAEAFGSHTLIPGSVTVSLNAIPSGEAFGDHVVTAGGSVISVTGIASTEAFGSHTLTPGAVTISPTGVGSLEAFGSASLNYTVTPDGIVSAEAFGNPALSLSLFCAGIASAEAFGNPSVLLFLQFVSPSGIASAEVFGLTSVVGGLPPVIPQLTLTMTTSDVTPAAIDNEPVTIPTISDIVGG